MAPIKSEFLRYNCEKMGRVELTRNTLIKAGETILLKIECCDHADACGVGLPYDEAKCESVRIISITYQ